MFHPKRFFRLAIIWLWLAALLPAGWWMLASCRQDDDDDNNNDAPYYGESGDGVRLDWLAVYSGIGPTRPDALLIDDAGNTYLAATECRTTGTETACSRPRLVVLRLDDEGLEIWRDTQGAWVQDAVMAPAPGGGVLVAARQCPDFDAMSGECLTSEILVTRYLETGEALWSETFALDPDSLERPTAIAADGQGHVYVAGTADDGARRLLICLDADGERRWANDEESGSFTEATAVLTFDDREAAAAIAGPFFHIALFDAEGQPLWEDVGADNGAASFLVADGAGHPTVVGYTEGAADRPRLTVIKYDAAGERQWVRHFAEGEAGYQPLFATMTADGELTVAGRKTSTAKQSAFLITYQADGERTAYWEGDWPATEGAIAAAVPAAGGALAVTGSLPNYRATEAEQLFLEAGTTLFSAEGPTAWIARPPVIGVQDKGWLVCAAGQALVVASSHCRETGWVGQESGVCLATDISVGKYQPADCDGCFIDGTCYADGARRTTDTRYQCRRDSSASGWTYAGLPDDEPSDEPSDEENDDGEDDVNHDHHDDEEYESEEVVGCMCGCDCDCVDCDCEDDGDDEDETPDGDDDDDDNEKSRPDDR